MSSKPLALYSQQENERSTILVNRLQELRREEEKVLKELRSLVYKYEKPR